MEITNPILKNYYSCQVCGKEFESKEELLISPRISPLCSSHCIFMLYYQTIKLWNKNTLISCGNFLNIPNYDKLLNNTLLFEVTKKYPKASLTSINIKGQKDKDKKIRTTVDKEGHKDNNSLPYVIRELSLSLSYFFNSGEKEVVPVPNFKKEEKNNGL